MKKFLIILTISLSLSHLINAQGIVTCVPCDMLGMSVNVGSSETSISIYNSGQYMTHPQSENIFVWEFSDQQGNILYLDTVFNDSFCNFNHNWSLVDTINVYVNLINDSANLDNWYVSKGLPSNGNTINCLFEDQLHWHKGPLSEWGSWTFIHNNSGIDLNNTALVNNFENDIKRHIMVIDMLGRQTSNKKNQLLLHIYNDGTAEKKILLD